MYYLSLGAYIAYTVSKIYQNENINMFGSNTIRVWGQRLETEMFYVYDDSNCEQKIQRQFSQLILSQIHKFINPNIYLSQRNYVIVSPNLI